MSKKLMNYLTDGLLVWGEENEKEPVLVLDHHDGRFEVALVPIYGSSFDIQKFDELKPALQNFIERM